MKKRLIVYYSRSGANYVNGTVKHLPVGNTEIVAVFLQKLSGAELFKLEPVQDYSPDYYECIDQARQDLRRNIRPGLRCWPDDICQYDVIYLGYPNYWGTMPMPVYSFLEPYDWSGAVIYPFCTHEGGGLGRSRQDLQVLCRGAFVAPGLAVRGAKVAHELAVIKKWYYGTLDGNRKENGAHV